MASIIERMLAAAGERVGLVPRDRVHALHEAHLHLLKATAARAWSEGVRASASALHEALGQERERVAQEAARGVLHSDHSTSRDVAAEAREVERALFALGLTDLLERGTYPPYTPRELDVHVHNDAARTDMTRYARWFVLRGRGLDEESTYANLDGRDL